jgi:hypothetical protein
VLAPWSVGSIPKSSARKSASLRSIFTHWCRRIAANWFAAHQHFGDGRATVKAATEAAAKAPELQSPMDAIAGEKGGINARRLHERRIESGLRFVKDGTRAGVAYWRAEVGGFRGFPPSPSREKANANGEDGYRIERLGTNSPNPPSDPVEVDIPNWYRRGENAVAGRRAELRKLGYA